MPPQYSLVFQNLHKTIWQGQPKSLFHHIANSNFPNMILRYYLQPPPPAWLTACLAPLHALYPTDSFEGMMRHLAVDAETELPVPAPPAGTPTPPNVKWMWLPRIRCHDCPGKLYTPGPEQSVENFAVHLRNRQHKERVESRLQSAARAESMNVSPG